MPFEAAPKTTVNPWVQGHPQEARALHDLARHLYSVPVELWDYSDVWCGSAGCALGHAPAVESCQPYLRRSATYAGSNGGFRVLSPERLGLPSEVSMKFFFGNY